MADQSVNLPSGFGGLMRFTEEYSSVFTLRPSYVLVFIGLIVAFRVFLGMFLK
jgi:preprotein translocase subunit Sec61beta